MYSLTMILILHMLLVTEANIGTYPSGEYFSWRMLGQDFDGDALEYQFIDLPLGLVGDSTTGWITGTPTIAADSIINYSFSINVRKASFTQYKVLYLNLR